MRMSIRQAVLHFCRMTKDELALTVFLDIETVPAEKNFTDLDERHRTLWKKKAANLRRTHAWREALETDEEMYDRCAGIYAEFSRVIVIVAGQVFWKDDKPELMLTRFRWHDEARLLRAFAFWMELLPSGTRLCAHNGKEFDFPVLARRMLANRVSIPALLSHAGRKPWEVPHLDTLELWKFGDHKHYTSLESIAATLGLPSGKQELDGSRVRDTYYLEQDTDKILRYCSMDVETLARVFMRVKEWPDELVIDTGNVMECHFDMEVDHTIE